VFLSCIIQAIFNFPGGAPILVLQRFVTAAHEHRRYEQIPEDTTKHGL